MLDSLAHSLSGLLVRNKSIDPEDREIAHYGIFLLLADVIQILILVILATWLKLWLPTTLFCLFFCSLKRYIGGWHAASHISCLGLFSAVAIAASYFGPYLKTLPSMLCALTSLLIVFLYAPIPHPNNPKTKDQLRDFRAKSLCSALLHVACISALCQTTLYSGCAALGGLSAALTLLLGRRYRHEKTWRYDM